MSHVNLPSVPVVAGDHLPGANAPRSCPDSQPHELDQEALTYQSLPLKLSAPIIAKVKHIGRMPPIPYPLDDTEEP